MAAILCLETATTNCSVALSIDGEVVALREENNQKYSHSENLHVFIEEVLAEATFEKRKLDAIAVSKGPGSYTGLRIGVSAAKGLCFALDIPLLSTPTLEVLARQAKGNNAYVIPMLDARRMEVYATVYNSNMEQVRETKAEILNENSFKEFLSENTKTIFLGDGSGKFKPLCNHVSALFINDAFPSATEMAFIAEEKLTKGDVEDIAYFEPYYLKEFIGG